MEQIIESKSILKNKELLTVLAECVFNPTEERLFKRVDKYMQNQNIMVFSAKNREMFLGIIVLDISDVNKIIIHDIAVLNNYQSKGIGGSLINHCISVFKPYQIIAETDDDAVGFYRKFGFDILALGDKYGAGIVRYECTLTCKQ
jgi:ribosomal protein S18 acetylase RimI-like enzyme